jgi:DNA-directed RNA polymerase specialized sigma subunit
VDSQAKDQDDYDIDAKLDEAMDKFAAEEGVDRDQLRQLELETWQRWKQSPNPVDFEWLWRSHQPVIQVSPAGRYMASTTLPKAAVRSDILRNYVEALDTFDPSRGRALHNHVSFGMKRTQRYLNTYQNIGKIPEDRSRLIGLLDSREAALQQQLGRLPSSTELADDMSIAAADIIEMQKAKITPRVVATLRREKRRDLVTEAPRGPETTSEADSPMLEHIQFIHGSLSPEQQVVLEHTFEGFGRPVIQDPMELAKQVSMSPQKIRAIKKQIFNKVKKYY